MLFADLCDSTAQVADIDPEDAQALLDGALRLMSDAVVAYGGTVSQILGDGLLALFGAPLALEDHAIRACLAAIEMQQQARSSTCGEGPAHRPMALRVGIDSGEVLVTPGGAHLSCHCRATGATMHVASRLEQLARPGAVVISGSTFRMIEGRLDASSIGSHELRGLAPRFELYELALDARPQHTTCGSRHHESISLVGRAETLKDLHAIAHEVLMGRMRLQGLRGEAGIGKSQVIAALAQDVRSNGFGVCSVAALAYRSRVPYGVVADLMRELMDVPNQLACLRCSTPGRVGQALHSLVDARLAAGPLLIVIDDIDLADRSSQRVLESLVRRLHDKRVLICVSYREEFVHGWAQDPCFAEIRIRPLPPLQMSRLAGDMLGEHASLGPVVAALLEKSDGNPFYLEQLVRTLVDNGTLTGAPSAYRCTNAKPNLHAPPTLAGIISARVDRLPREAKASLEAAAVLGEPFCAGLIASMQNLTVGDVNRHLTLAASAGLLLKLKGDDMAPQAFRHALSQDVIAAALTRPRRELLHRAACVALRTSLARQAVDRSSDLTAVDRTDGAGTRGNFPLQWMFRLIAN